jgi:hypothetical protein
MRTMLAFCTLAYIFTSPVMAQTVDKEKLREQAHRVFWPPHDVGIKFGAVDKPIPNQPPPEELENKLVKLNAEMKGDISDLERYLRLREILLQLNRPQLSKGLDTNVLVLLRKKTMESPDDGKALFALGQELHRECQFEESEEPHNALLELDRWAWDNLIASRSLAASRNVHD